MRVCSPKTNIQYKQSTKVGGALTAQNSSGGMKSRLLSALLTGVNRAHPFLSKGSLGDEEQSHVNALYRLAHTASPGASTQSMLLLFNFFVGEDKSGKGGRDEKIVGRFYRCLYSKMEDAEMYSGKSLTMFFNLIYRAMKADKDEARLVAFAKRLVHMSMHTPGGGVVGGALFLLATVISSSEKNSDVSRELIKTFHEKLEGTFNPMTRDPAAAFEDSETKETSSVGNIWEGVLMKFHFHPSVSVFAKSLVSTGGIEYKGDPMKDFNLAPFLDRFSFRNPKSKERLMKEFRLGESVAERRSGGRGLHIAGGVAVNDPSFLKQKAADN